MNTSLDTHFYTSFRMLDCKYIHNLHHRLCYIQTDIHHNNHFYKDLHIDQYIHRYNQYIPYNNPHYSFRCSFRCIHRCNCRYTSPYTLIRRSFLRRHHYMSCCTSPYTSCCMLSYTC